MVPILKELKEFFDLEYNKNLLYTIKPIIEKIDGYLINSQIDLIFAIYNNFSGNSVEIGAFLGRTTITMGYGSLNNDKQLNVVDHFMGSDEEHKQRFDYKSALEEFTANVITDNCIDVNIIELPSYEASKKFDDNSLDIVFIDAMHDYDNVKLDILSWFPKLKQNGLMIGHDYPHPNDPNGGFEDLFKAVNEHVRDNNIFFNFSHCCGIWGAYKK